jgi:hypothetical protein
LAEIIKAVESKKLVHLEAFFRDEKNRKKYSLENILIWCSLYMICIFVSQSEWSEKKQE